MILGGGVGRRRWGRRRRLLDNGFGVSFVNSRLFPTHIVLSVSKTTINIPLWRSIDEHWCIAIDPTIDDIPPHP
jgi:hypothetical protein